MERKQKVEAVVSDKIERINRVEYRALKRNTVRPIWGHVRKSTSLEN